MKKSILKNLARARRIQRVRAKVEGTTERPRLAVRRTLAHIYAQVIDDVTQKTLAAASDADVKATGLKKSDIAAEVGKIIAARALEKKVKAVVFDRRDKRYHGRVKALADAAREAGLDF